VKIVKMIKKLAHPKREDQERCLRSSRNLKKKQLVTAKKPNKKREVKE
jgi:hypothetical protein